MNGQIADGRMCSEAAVMRRAFYRHSGKRRMKAVISRNAELLAKILGIDMAHRSPEKRIIHHCLQDSDANDGSLHRVNSRNMRKRNCPLTILSTSTCNIEL